MIFYRINIWAHKLNSLMETNYINMIWLKSEKVFQRHFDYIYIYIYIYVYIINTNICIFIYVCVWLKGVWGKADWCPPASEVLKLMALNMQTDMPTCRLTEWLLLLHFAGIGEKYPICDRSWLNQIKRSNNRKFHLRAHLFLSYNLM